MPTPNNIDSGLERAMDASLNAYAAGDERFFDFLTDDARIYVLNASEPIIGRKEFQGYFGPTLRGAKREVSIVAQDIQARGDRAVLSQTLQIMSQGVASYVRQTVIWEGRGDEWRMSHIHNAMVGQPVALGELPAGLEGIRVLNERIATVAATVGVAQ